jgi:hypothetical protein
MSKITALIIIRQGLQIGAMNSGAYQVAMDRFHVIAYRSIPAFRARIIQPANLKDWSLFHAFLRLASPRAEEGQRG